MQVLKSSLLLISLALASAPVTASDGLADDYCFRADQPTPQNQVWEVTSDFNNRLIADVPLTPPAFSDADGAALLDVLVGNLPRYTRAKVHQRSALTFCSYGDGGCVRALQNWEAPIECGFAGYAAYVGGSLGGQWDVTVCQENLASWAALPMVMQHEIGHVHRLAHVNDESNSDACNNISNCATSDGCDGETMCRQTGCDSAGMGYYSGDGKGLRQTFNGTTAVPNRPWKTDTTQVPGLTNFAFAAANIGDAKFAPRIDCARSTNPSVNTCGVVAAYTGAEGSVLRMRTLNGWSATGWTNIAIGSTTTTQVYAAPDIALSADGSQIWITHVYSENITNNTQLRHVQMPLGQMSGISLGYVTGLPLRVAPIGTDAALVLGASGSSTRWKLQRVDYSPVYGFLTVTDVPLGFLDSDTSKFIITDFDFDCRASECVIAAVLWDRTIGTWNSVQRRRFTVTGTPTAPVVTFLDADWIVHANQRAQSVQGVAKTTGRVYVSSGRPIQSSSDVTNTRVIQYANGAATSAEATLQLQSDSTTCNVYGNVSGASQHGGTSIAWCQSCNGGAGTLESIHLAADSNGECY